MTTMTIHVRNLDYMRLFRMDMKVFMEQVKTALDECRNDVAKTQWWLQYDRLPHWQAEVRRREARLNEAKGDLLGAKLTDSSETQFAERQAVMKAERALEEARQKVQVIARRLASFEDEATEALQHCRKLYHDVDHLLPRGVQALDGMIEALESYSEDAPPQEVTGELPEDPAEESE